MLHLSVDCDVLVVGAGPAGSSAAMRAAIGGAKTLFIDKKKEVGVPVQCAEGIGSYLTSFLPFKIPSDHLILKIGGVSFSVNDIIVERTGGMWSGYAINRAEFDKWLAGNAVKAGANLQLETEIIDLETRDDFIVTKVGVKTKSGVKEIRPKVVIAADGVDSKVLKLLGFKINLEKTGSVYSFELGGLDLKTNYDHIFFGDFAPGGYGYVFPLSNNRANIGVAALFKKREMKNFYNKFIELSEMKKIINSNSYVIIEKKGFVPFLPQTEKWHYGNVLLAGDAANQNIKPFVEGILPSIICGDIAGHCAAEHIKKGDRLDLYKETVNKKLDYIFEYSDNLANIMYDLGKNPDNKYHLIRLGIASDLFSLKELDYLNTLDYSSLKEIMLNRSTKIKDL